MKGAAPDAKKEMQTAGFHVQSCNHPPARPETVPYHPRRFVIRQRLLFHQQMSKHRRLPASFAPNCYATSNADKFPKHVIIDDKQTGKKSRLLFSGNISRKHELDAEARRGSLQHPSAARRRLRESAS
jgi:hypothetical protein